MNANRANRIYGFRSSLIGFTLTLLLGLTSAHSIPIVWINEFHYDNTSSDVGEFVEVAGVAGTDLSGYEVILYNGNGGALYDTISFAGVLDDEMNGFGALSFSATGMQNGSPDGLALFDGSSVLQFLSYEGSFTAVDGPASGMTSIDIGVSESSSTSIGASLQLTGSGSQYNDFTWDGPLAETPGDLNIGQTMVSTSVPDSLPPSFVAAVLLGFLVTVTPRRTAG